MSYHTKETILKSHDEIRKAWLTILGICPHLQFSGSGNPITGALEGSVEVGSGVKQPIERMSEFSVGHDSYGLFEYGRPKLIQKTHWIWRSDYLKMEGAVVVPFKVWCMEYGSASVPEGIVTPEKMGSRDNVLRLKLRFPSFGMSSLLNDEGRVRSALDGAPIEHRNEYQRAVDAALRDIGKWQKMLKEATVEFEEVMK